MKKRNLITLLSLSLCPSFLVSGAFSFRRDANTNLDKENPIFERILEKFKGIVTVIPFKHYDNNSILQNKLKIVAPKYEIDKSRIRLSRIDSDSSGINQTYNVDLGEFESDYPIDILINWKHNLITDNDDFRLSKTQKKKGENITSEEKITLDSLKSVVFNKDTNESRYKLNLSSALDEKEAAFLKKELETKKKESATLYSKFITTNKSIYNSSNLEDKTKLKKENEKIKKQLQKSKQRQVEIEKELYSDNPKTFVLNSRVKDNETNTIFIFKQTFKLKNNFFNINSSFKEDAKGTYFEKQTLWFDTSRFASPFLANMPFLLEPKNNKDHKNLGFFVESIFSDKFYIPNIDFTKNELYLYDLTKLKTNHLGRYVWPSAEYYSQEELKNYFENKEAYSGGLKNLILFGIKNKKTKLTKWTLVMLLPPYTTQKDTINDFWAKLDKDAEVEKNKEEIGKLKALLHDSSKSAETKKKNWISNYSFRK